LHRLIHSNGLRVSDFPQGGCARRDTDRPIICTKAGKRNHVSVTGFYGVLVLGTDGHGLVWRWFGNLGIIGRVRNGVLMLVKRFTFKRNNDRGGFQWTAESEIERPGFYVGSPLLAGLSPT